MMQRPIDKERFMRDSARYLAIVDWAKRRYTENGRCLVAIASSPSRFTRIEDLAATKYLNSTERFAGRVIWGCPPLPSTAYDYINRAAA